MVLKFRLVLLVCVLFITSFFSSCCTFYQGQIADIKKQVMHVKGVKDVVVVEDNGIWTIELTLKITYCDERSLLVHGVNKNLSGDLRIEKIGKYNLVTYYYLYNAIGDPVSGNKKNALSASYNIPVRLIEKNIDKEMENLYDVINNYDKILSFIETLQKDPNCVLVNIDAWNGIPNSGNTFDDKGKYKLFTRLEE